MEFKDIYLYKASLLRVVDGDTIDVAVDLGFKTKTEQRLRLARINCPEPRGKEKVAGKEASEALKALLAIQTELFVETEKTGSFGRYIAEVYLPVEFDEELETTYLHAFNGQYWINVNDYLVFHGYATYL